MLFFPILTDFANYNVEKGHQGKRVLSSILSEEINGNCLEVTSKMTKI